MNNKTSTTKRLTLSVAIAIVLSVCLCITTYALFYATVIVEGNYFKTGMVSIDLNGGKPVIEGHEYLFEPGMTVEKPFYIQHQKFHKMCQSLDLMIIFVLDYSSLSFLKSDIDADGYFQSRDNGQKGGCPKPTGACM